MSGEPQRHDEDELDADIPEAEEPAEPFVFEQSGEAEPWAPARGPITKIVTWAILIGIAMTVLAMIAVLIFDRG